MQRFRYALNIRCLCQFFNYLRLLIPLHHIIALISLNFLYRWKLLIRFWKSILKNLFIYWRKLRRTYFQCTHIFGSWHLQIDISLTVMIHFYCFQKLILRTILSTFLVFLQTKRQRLKMFLHQRKLQKLITCRPQMRSDLKKHFQNVIKFV